MPEGYNEMPRSLQQPVDSSEKCDHKVQIAMGQKLHFSLNAPSV